jgi:hypothetical protein
MKVQRDIQGNIKCGYCGYTDDIVGVWVSAYHDGTPMTTAYICERCSEGRTNQFRSIGDRRPHWLAPTLEEFDYNWDYEFTNCEKCGVEMLRGQRVYSKDGDVMLCSVCASKGL